MLYHLLFPLHEQFSVLYIFRYITFRAIYATITALMISFILGPWLIDKLSKLQIGQSIRKDGPQSHFKKEGTPTMGGALILLAVVLPTLLWTDLSNIYVWITLLVTVGFGAVGFVDDYRKVRRRSSDGLSARQKMLWLVLIATTAGIMLYAYPPFRTTLALPFFKGLQPDLGLCYVPFAVLVIVGASNAVNLTDGMDGLAPGCMMTCSGVMLLVTWIVGVAAWAGFFRLPLVINAEEMTIIASAILGSCMGFLWYNAHPAQVFMGDVGSLSLGGALGTIAVITKQEIVLVIVGGIFVVEALSVIVQVSSFKLLGKRIFRMAPIHHHFELKGWAEPKIIVRFWIISIILALVALSTLKLR